MALRTLRLRWLVIAVSGLAGWLGFFCWLSTWWGRSNSYRWLAVAGLVLGSLLRFLWRGLGDNRRHGETKILARLGPGNLISILRGFILVLFSGFLFSPWPDRGWTAWLPGLLYTLATLPDYLDGAAARWTNHVTVLGERLDISLDSFGGLAASLLAVQYGQLPWWYLAAGLARYVFLAGIWLRGWLHLPVYEFPFSVRRRGYGALTIGFLFMSLYPLFSPPGTRLVATIFLIYLLGGFLWDWFVMIGWLPARPGATYRRWEQGIVSYAPLLFRLALAGYLPALASALFADLVSASLWIETFGVVCLILGVAGRFQAVLLLSLLGLAYPVPGVLQTGLMVIYANLLFLGTGRYSLWPIENRLIYHRLGEVARQR